MKFLKSMKKGLKNMDVSTMVVIGVCVVFVVMLYRYSSSKSIFGETLGGRVTSLSGADVEGQAPVASGAESEWAEIGDVDKSDLQPTDTIDPRELLPRNVEGKGCDINPRPENSDVAGVNFLPQPTLFTNANPNLSLRRDPPIAQSNVNIPWGVSTTQRDEYSAKQGLCM